MFIHKLSNDVYEMSCLMGFASCAGLLCYSLLACIAHNEPGGRD